MISVQQLTVSFGGTDLFSNISFFINAKDRIGLVGKNGAGKSTLLKIIAGFQQPTSGCIVMPDGARVGYLPQQMVYAEGRTVMEEARMAFEEILSLDREIHELGEEISARTDYETESYMNLVDRLGEVTERFNILGGMNLDSEAERTLMGLGFVQSDFTRQTTTFSGGWRMRIELAKVLLGRPDIVLLDEPTNHLDIESITWLESFLADYPGAVVLVSHDRAFLDNVTRRTVELSLGSLTDYKVPYSEYVILRNERREQQMAAWRNQQKMLQDTKDFIERFRYKATKAVQVQSRIKQMEKVEIIEIDEEDSSAINIKFSPAPRSGTIVAEGTSIIKRFGDKTVLNGIDIQVQRGEKVAFVGKNGEGKTTLSRIMMGELPHESGTFKIGHNVRIGYFAQNQDEIMDENITVFDTLERIAVGDIRTRLRDLLGAFLFRGDDVDKKVKVLSGGERSRLAILKLLLEPYNLLILDEPTNHLDMRSKDLLKKALQQYDGTLVLVSHDRDFLDGLVQKVYEFRGGAIYEHIGSIYDFLNKRKLDTLHELNKKTEIEDNDTGAGQQGKKDYFEKKAFEKKKRKVTNFISQAENTISALESEMQIVLEKLSDPAQYTEDLMLKHSELEKELSEKMDEWEQLQKELEEVNNEE